jgi:F-type H+-transporting ATPase subunit delta
LLSSHTELQQVLVNPAVPALKKRELVSRLLEPLQVSGPVGKLLLLLAERDRLELLPDLVDVYHARLMEHLNVIKAEVTTAAPLPAEDAARLEQRLAAATGRTVTMTTRVDPEIIGGMVTRIGGTVYDGSVATQLTALRQRLAER